MVKRWEEYEAAFQFLWGGQEGQDAVDAEFSKGCKEK